LKHGVAVYYAQEAARKLMLIRISSGRTVLEQSGWSVGFCSRCNRLEALRICARRDEDRVLGIVAHSHTDELCLCELCDELAKPALGVQTIPFADWRQLDGIRSLSERCAPKLVPDAPTLGTEREIGDLLDLVQRRSAMTNVKLGPGPTAGLLLGLLVAIPAALGLIYLADMATGAAWFWSLAIDGFLGLVVGAFAAAVYDGRSYAQMKIVRAYLKYGLDAEELARAAHSQPRRIRLAVEKILGVVRRTSLPEKDNVAE
jgi:hypothetical protein